MKDRTFKIDMEMDSFLVKGGVELSLWIDEGSDPSGIVRVSFNEMWDFLFDVHKNLSTGKVNIQDSAEIDEIIESIKDSLEYVELLREKFYDV